jgi:hypothetical protein
MDSLRFRRERLSPELATGLPAATAAFNPRNALAMRRASSRARAKITIVTVPVWIFETLPIFEKCRWRPANRRRFRGGRTW